MSTTPQLGLQFKYDEQGIHLHGFADATWKVPPLSHSFISYVLYLNDKSGAIETVCKRLTSTVPQSIMEAELFAIYELLRSLIRTKNQLIQMNLLTDSSQITIYSDSESCIKYCSSDQYSTVNRHFLPKLNLVKQYVHNGQLLLLKVKSECNIADINTKVLPAKHFQFLRNALLTGSKLAEEI